MNNTSSADSASRISVAANRAASIRAPAGTAIQCIAGKLWLTQEGDSRDHVVPAGMTFCTDRPGRVVVSSVEGESLAIVRETAPAYCVRGRVTLDSLERFTHAARAAQAEYVAGLFARLVRWVSSRAARRRNDRVARVPFATGLLRHGVPRNDA